MRVPTALIISFVEWAGAFQRPQHLALGLARHGWQVTYAAPGYLHRRSRQVASGLTLPAGLRVEQPPALPGESRLGAIWHLNLMLMRRHLRRLARTPWDVVIFNDPRRAALACALPARRRIFDCMDDLSAQATQPAHWGAREAEAVNLVDAVWTGTASLADRLRPIAAELAKPLRYIPCGVDAEFFAHPAAPTENLRALLPPGDGPLAGYFGAINERVRPECLIGLLRAGWRVLLIGPGSSRAPQLPNDPRLRWIGPRPYAELPAWLSLFDLGLIPYDTAGPHRFLYPVKALEYLAGGKPVLATPLPDVVRFLSSYVELAEAGAPWEAAGVRLLRSLEPARARAALGQAYARSRNWDAMVEEMLSDMTAGLPA